MADIRLGSKSAVAVPALTDKHTITQGGVDYSETNTQVLGLLAGGITNKIVTSDTTDSTTKDTGSIITEGGIGVEKSIVTGADCKLHNITIGHGAGSDLTNTALGQLTLQANTTGVNNTGVGRNALANNTTGTENTAVGRQALPAITSGHKNTAIGHEALEISTTGYKNTAVGYQAGQTVTSGFNLTCLGNGANPSAATASNEITLGDSSVGTLRCAVTTITALSDERDKTNIQKLKLGLDFIMKLEPKTFQWDKRDWYNNNISDGTKKSNDIQMGLIAQDVIKIENELNCDWAKIVNRENPSKYEMSLGKIMMPLVLAIQELKNEIDKLKKGKDNN